MRRINSTFERKGDVRRGDGGDFSFMLPLFSLNSSKRFSLFNDVGIILKLERFWKEKRFSTELLQFFHREICRYTYKFIYCIYFALTYKKYHT